MKRLLRVLCAGLMVGAHTSVFAQTPVANDGQVRTIANCARLPAFIKTKGLVQPVVIDTSIARLPGLVIRELTGKRRLYQGDSWKQTGHVGSTVRDAQGNIYVIPIPSVALDTNPLNARNRVYIVDSSLGEMSLFIDLPLDEGDSQKNPFGTLGITLDCETNSLYVSSVAGSTPRKVSGKIYQIDLGSRRIVDEFSGVDSLGLGIVKHGESRRLYYGDARSSSVYSIALSRNGAFSKAEKPRHELSLLNIKNGDSTQVKKIKFVELNGRVKMQLDETEFAYRMGADTARRYKVYTFEWKDGWTLAGMSFK